MNIINSSQRNKRNFFLDGVVFAISLDFIFSDALNNFMILNLFFLSVSAYLFISYDNTLDAKYCIGIIESIKVVLFFRTGVDYPSLYIFTGTTIFSFYWEHWFPEILNSIIISGYLMFLKDTNELYINLSYFLLILCFIAILCLKKINYRFLFLSSFVDYSILFIRSNGVFCWQLQILFTILSIMMVVVLYSFAKFEMWPPSAIGITLGIGAIGLFWLGDGFLFKKETTVICHVSNIYMFVLLNIININ